MNNLTLKRNSQWFGADHYIRTKGGHRTLGYAIRIPKDYPHGKGWAVGLMGLSADDVRFSVNRHEPPPSGRRANDWAIMPTLAAAKEWTYNKTYRTSAFADD